MEKSRLEMKVGLFVAIGLVLLAVLLVQFSKGTSLFRGTYSLKLHAVNVGGLKMKSGVLLSGVQVGTVSQIQLAPDGKSVTITLKVYKDFPIYHDARFIIEQAGFLGDQFVAVVPTTNAPPVLADGAEVNCQEPFNLQEVARSAAGFIQRLDGTAKKLDEAVTDLRAQVLNAQTLASFGTSITNLRVFTEQAIDAVKGINGIVATNGSQVSLAVSNAVFFTTELNRLAGSAQDILATNGDNLTIATKNIEDLTITFKQLAADLQAGKGLAGTVLQNQQLATNVQTIAANLSITASNLNRVGLWGILWSRKPAATNTFKTSTSPNRARP
ncbi:MAG TPA: MlaD family protein [Candidatus Limnocylindrales bacterium]|nr:MlaD family protein [Candidatus Limnocylindrales bacterium]